MPAGIGRFRRACDRIALENALSSANREQTVRVQNCVLAGLAPASFERLRPFLQPVALKRRAILQDYHHPIEYIYSIERGVASLLARTQRDGPVEIAMVGRLGFAGVTAVLGIQRAPDRCLMSVPGYALRIAASDLRRVAHR